MDFIRIVPAEHFRGTPAPMIRPYGFYANAFSLHERTIADCYRLIKGLTLPPRAGYYQKEIRTPFLAGHQYPDWDRPMPTGEKMAVQTLEGDGAGVDSLDEAEFVLLGVSLDEADRELDVFPATWRALAYIVSDPERMYAEGPGESEAWQAAEIHTQFRTLVGESGLLAQRKHLRVEVACRILGNPARTDNVAWMQDRGRKPTTLRLVEQIRLNSGFVNAILAERRAWLRLTGWHLDTRAMHPDRATVQEMLDVATQRIDQLPGTVGMKADHVDHGVGRQRADLRAKVTLLFGRRAVNSHLLHRVPRRMGLIGCALSTAVHG